MSMAPRVTSAQISAFTVVTLLRTGALAVRGRDFWRTVDACKRFTIVPMHQQRSPRRMNAPVG
jgi:hypothetical protein